MVKVRNILLVGKTGSGKSTLANVITGTNKFKEVSGLTSGTNVFQEEFLELKGNKYRIVDTVGLDDNSGLDEREVLFRVAQGICSMKEGLTQAFFVVNSRFDKRELEIFESIKRIIFDNNVIGYSTIVVTKFPNFENEKECKNQTQSLKDREDAIGEIARRCNGIVFVDNASLDIEIEENLPEKKKKFKLMEKEVNQDKREGSQKVLWNHLETECQSFYCPSYWNRITVNACDYINDKIRAEERLKVKNLTPETKELIEKEKERARKAAVEEVKKEIKLVATEELVATEDLSSTQFIFRYIYVGRGGVCCQ